MSQNHNTSTPLRRLFVRQKKKGKNFVVLFTKCAIKWDRKKTMNFSLACIANFSASTNTHTPFFTLFFF